MAHSFRLLRAVGGFERRDLVSSMTVRPKNALDVRFSSASDQSNQSWVTIVIGRNGVGKSRLLAAITDLIDIVDRHSSVRWRDQLSMSELEFFCDGKLCKVEMDELDRPFATLDGVRCSLDELPLPTKVIAITSSPFDKFRVPRSIYHSLNGGLGIEETGRYSYLGLRDRTGRSSPTAVVFRALEGLFEASQADEKRRAQIAEIFGFLGYRAYVEVIYEVSTTNRNRMESIVEGVSDDLFGPQKSAAFREPLQTLLERDPSIIGSIRDASIEVLDRSVGKRTFRVRADFKGRSKDEELFRRIQVLRKADLLRVKAVEVERVVDGALLDLKLVSSGELSIATSLLGLASVIQDGSLILIDEPEISLHPEWQTSYIDLLLKTFGMFRGCHFVLATHSPLILSDISPKNSTVVTLGDEARLHEDSAQIYAGQSVDYLLASAFRTPGSNNLYLKQEMIKALRLVADGKVLGEEFAAVLNEFERLLPSLDPNGPIVKLVHELRTARASEVGLQ